MSNTAIIVSISSDIGIAMAERWLACNWTVLGTYRTRSAATDRLERAGVRLLQCDLAEATSVDACAKSLIDDSIAWDALIVLAGTTEPIGPFGETDFDHWAKSIDCNFTNQLRIVHRLLPLKRSGGTLEPMVLFFAGGGTNGAPVNYSAYTVSKIGLIKMCELLDAEIPDVRFAIVGPGWVKTKIHDETLRAGVNAGTNLARTVEKLQQDEFTPMNDVLDCCDWLLSSSREAVGGRNFSVVFDQWQAESLVAKLRSDSNLYKLRRFGNDLLVDRTVPDPMRTVD